MICPICGREYHNPPAISRRDSYLICSRCGTREALEDAGVEKIETILEAMYGEECE